MVTIQDVADRAGVSISTVSNVLTKKKFVSEPLQKRVYEAIRELDYVVDSVASNMKRGYTKTIGVITSDICGLFYPYVLKGIYEVISRYGYSLTIYDSHVQGNETGLEREAECFSHLFSNRVDGVIFVSNILKKREREYLKKLNREACRLKTTPLVSIERNFSQYGIDSVYYDNVKAAGMAVEHLIESGCRNIAHISGPEGEQIPDDRRRGYVEALKARRMKVDLKNRIAYGDYSHQSGYLAMEQLLETGVPVDGVYIANDQMAIGAMKLLKEKGIRVPDQMKIIGSDDVFMASMMEPSLSTVHIKKKTMGRRAAEILLQRIAEKEGEERQETIAEEMETKLVVRSSTGRATPEFESLMDW